MHGANQMVLDEKANLATEVRKLKSSLKTNKNDLRDKDDLISTLNKRNQETNTLLENAISDSDKCSASVTGKFIRSGP